MKERLQKVLAHHQVASRRKAEQFILDGRVSVNGEIVRELGTKVDEHDVVLVDGKAIIKTQNIYIIMNKPRGYISSVSDEKNRPVILDLLSKEDQDARVYPVGRLDYDTAGLILLTNDGELTQRLTHPKFEVDKTYLVRVEGIVIKQKIRDLRAGIKLEDGSFARSPFVRLIERDTHAKTSLIEMVLTEGRNQQVKRMMEAIGHPVKKLTRTRYAFLDLEGIERGGYRYLKVHEVKKLFGYKYESI
jgi:23S rRNA pseudouridine2605 synthase